VKKSDLIKAAALIGAVMLIIDFVRILRRKPPVFAVKTPMKDGKTRYTGIGYTTVM